MNRWMFGSLLAAVILSSCSTAKPPPRFNEASDEFKIKTAVYDYLLQKNLWGGGDYGAIFLTGSDEATAAVIRKFPNHVPPIKSGDRMLIQPNTTPIDRDTGKRAMILTADVPPAYGNEAEAVGSWYAGSGSSGRYTFAFKKINDGWQIQSVR
jgi:hypothetical protein